MRSDQHLSPSLFRTVVVDDEPPALRKLRALVEADAELKLMEACATGAAAIQAITRYQPDLLLLDIQMPEQDGFAVLRALQPQDYPVLIFTTAYDQYALEAFHHDAVGYLLKPFDVARFQEVLAKAKALCRGRKLDPSASSHEEDLVERLVVPTRAGRRVVEVQDIEYVSAEGNYVGVHVGGIRYLHRETLVGLAAKLDPHTFVRTHRSYFINLSQVQLLTAAGHGDARIRLLSGVEVPLSRTYRQAFEARMATLD